MSEYANSSNSNAILKEMYADKKKRRIPHYAEGGEIDQSNIPPQSIPLTPLQQATFAPTEIQKAQFANPESLQPVEPDYNSPVDLAAFEASKAGEIGRFAADEAGVFRLGSTRPTELVTEKVAEPMYTPEIKPSNAPITNENTWQMYQATALRQQKADEVEKAAKLAAMKERESHFAGGGEIQSPESTPESSSGGIELPEGAQWEDEKYGGALEQAKTFGEGALQGAMGPAAPVAEQAFSQAVFNQSPEETSKNILGRQEVHPMTSMAGNITGLGASMATGAGEGAIAANLGEHIAGGLFPKVAEAAAAKAAGEIVPEVSTLAKIGSRAASDAVANMAISAGDEASKMILGDPGQTTDTTAINLGLSGLIGGTIGAGIGAVAPLWQAKVAPKAAEALRAVQKALGGVEGKTPDAVNEVVQMSGLHLDPAQKAVLSGDPKAQALFDHLLQTDVDASGKEVQAGYTKIHNDAGDLMIEALGKDPSAAIPTDLSKYEAGKNIGETLAKEYQETQEPLSKEFERLKDKYSKAELTPDKTIPGVPDNSNPYEPKPGVPQVVPGTISNITRKLGDMAVHEGWMSSPSSDIMREMNRVMKELPNLKTAKDLSNYISRVGENTASTLPFGQQTPLSRAGALMKNVLRDAESEVAIQHLGEKEGADSVSQFRSARAAYAKQSQLKEYLNDFLKVGGSTSGFAKGLRGMAQTDGEAILNRLSGKNSADLLDFMSKNYPKTADAIRSQHIDFALQHAAEKAEPGSKINVGALRKSIEKMSPELRKFAVSPDALTKVDAIGQVLDRLEPKNYNYSNTARTVTKSMSTIPGGVLGAIAALSGHGPLAAGLVGVLSKYFVHDIPDAMRLGLLKFLGSSAPLDSVGMKSALEHISAALKGESTLSKAAKNVFKPESEVLAEQLHPTEKDRTKLQKQIDEINNNPHLLLNGSNPVGHYMPENGESQSQTVSRAISYLNSIKPGTKTPSPLDTPIKPTSQERAVYNNALDIAHQPLVLMNKIKAGTATPQDVQALQAMYPNLYNRISQKLTHEMIESKNKGNIIPYRTRIGLSHFLGQPMDSTMTPDSIMSAQPQPPQQQQAVNNGPQTPGKNKHNFTGLSKAPAQAMTQDQARNARQNKQ